MSGIRGSHLAVEIKPDDGETCRVPSMKLPTTVARHGSYVELQLPSTPAADVEHAFVPPDELGPEALARKRLETLLRKVFRMCDTKGTGTVSMDDVANMDWLISEATGHPTIVSTQRRSQKIRQHAESRGTVALTVGEFVLAKLEDIKARQAWWVDIVELYVSAQPPAPSRSGAALALNAWCAPRRTRRPLSCRRRWRSLRTSRASRWARRGSWWSCGR